VLATLVIAIAQLATAILPVIPQGAGAVLDQIGVGAEHRSFSAILAKWYDDLISSGHIIAPPTPLFPRLELPAEES
jgi:methionyl-tRNA synthetase